MQQNTLQFHNANDQQYRIVDEETLLAQAQSLIELVAQLRGAGQIQQHQNMQIQIVAGTEQRRKELCELLPPVDPQKKLFVNCDLYPFNFHSYKWRGKSSLMVVIDRAIHEEYFAGFDRTIPTNHQLTLNHTLTTLCHVGDKAYSELYFIV